MAARLAAHPEEYDARKASVFDAITAALVAAEWKEWRRRVFLRWLRSQGIPAFGVE
jgi:hypothetical protein